MTTGITIAITMALLALIKVATGKRIVTDIDGKYTLRMQKVYNILGWVFAVIAIALVAALLFELPTNAIEWGAFAFFFLSFGFVALLCFSYYRNHQVVFDDTNIVVTGPLNKVTTSSWDKIVQSKYSYNAGLLTLIDKNGQKLKINHHLIGLATFIEMLESKTGLGTGALEINRNGR